MGKAPGDGEGKADFRSIGTDPYLLYGSAMSKTYDIRSANFQTLLEELELPPGCKSRKVAFAEKFGVGMGRMHSIYRYQRIGTLCARRMEQVFGKPEGWMDEDHQVEPWQRGLLITPPPTRRVAAVLEHILMLLDSTPIDTRIPNGEYGEYGEYTTIHRAYVVENMPCI